MLAITAEWVAKAEGDWITAGRELRARRQPNYDAACFHSQQCAEKYMKARLQEAAFPFGRTHDLISLLNLLFPIEPAWVSLDPHARALIGFAVNIRYPGVTAAKSDARAAVAACREIRRAARHSLGLAP
jgi:HEPN domain-containing protein